MYAQGQGVKQDIGEAARLYQKAAEQGHEQAKKALPLAEEELRKQRQAPGSQPSSSLTCANCGVAEAVVYCGKECDMLHWKKTSGHKAVCK